MQRRDHLHLLGAAATVLPRLVVVAADMLQEPVPSRECPERTQLARPEDARRSLGCAS
jgi:hypothetical protein